MSYANTVDGRAFRFGPTVDAAELVPSGVEGADAGTATGVAPLDGALVGADASDEGLVSTAGTAGVAVLLEPLQADITHTANTATLATLDDTNCLFIH